MLIDNSDLFRNDDIQHYLNKIGELNVNNSIYKIIVNLIDKCNRKCIFCPRGSKYFNYVSDPIVIELSTLKKLCIDLGIQHQGNFTFGGFGEPTLVKNIDEYVTLIKDYCPHSTITVITNGYDLKSLLKIDDIDKIEISLYDNKCINDIKQQLIDSKINILIKDIKITSQYFNNRGGNAINECKMNTPLERCCNFPFYKMFLDTNGDVLLCCSDWNRDVVIGNILKQNVYDIWRDSYKDIRLQLLNGNRMTKICSQCSMDGLKAGNQFQNFWRDFYDNN